MGAMVALSCSLASQRMKRRIGVSACEPSPDNAYRLRNAGGGCGALFDPAAIFGCEDPSLSGESRPASEVLVFFLVRRPLLEVTDSAVNVGGMDGSGGGGPSIETGRELLFTELLRRRRGTRSLCSAGLMPRSGKTAEGVAEAVEAE